MGIRVLSAVLSSPNGHNALIIAARPHAGGGGGGWPFYGVRTVW